jgi:hypothetical protein
MNNIVYRCKIFVKYQYQNLSFNKNKLLDTKGYARKGAKLMCPMLFSQKHKFRNFVNLAEFCRNLECSPKKRAFSFQPNYLRVFPCLLTGHS